ncbi:hypothetical protein ACLUV9_04235 [Limosilactobacillus balticus]|uniref:hypothetical protein n=1 Tax=Limosilactobacillus balticus TaxID=2759747 RepID=UPI0039967A08
MNTESNKKEPQFWKGDPSGGFATGLVAGFIIGLINICSFNIPWLGRICFIAIWLVMGTQPRFKDKRTLEQIAKDDQEREQRLQEYREEAKARQEQRQAKKLKKNELKIQKNEIKLQKHQLKNRNKIKCPKCKSTNVQPLGVHKKGFSVGKAVAGTVLAHGTVVGPLAGFAGKNSKKTDFVCMNCGKQFKK